MRRHYIPTVTFALITACGDDGTTTAAVSESAGSTGSTTTSASATNNTNVSTSGTTAEQPTTSGTGTGTDSDSASTSGTTTSSSTGTTEAVTSSTSGTTSTGTSTGTTTDDTSTTEPDTTGSTSSTTGNPQVCMPGKQICADENNYQVCDDMGSGYGPPTPCAPTESCQLGQCVAACELIKQDPSSIGCSFFATKMDNFYSNVGDPAQNDSMIAGNISSTKSVNAQLYFVPIGSNVEQPQGGPVVIPPKGTYTFVLSTPEIDSQTTVRQGGVYRLATDLPIVAYQHSPIGATATNDASMLLPEHALTGNYIVTSYPGTIGAYPSYFTAIATQDGTTVDFTVKGATAGGGGIPALAVNGSHQLMLNRYQLINVVVAQQQGGDLSGTTITASKPLHVVGATECANIPNAQYTFCDHMEEVPFPLEYWGKEYVAPTSPKRNNESTHWRVYAGEDNTTINTTPAQPGFPQVLNKGQYYQFATKQNFVATADKPFLPVAFLESENPNAGTGDPAMYQMVPTAQFLSSYAFVTGTSYTVHYAQIIRPMGGPDVQLDGVVVGGYVAVGNYEVANVVTSEGAHFAESAAPFGILQIGYTGVTSYAYPGGLKLEVINPQ